MQKIVGASSFKELIDKGSEKLNLNKENVQLYLSDGCEVDDMDGLLYAQKEKVLLYMLQSRESLPKVSAESCVSDTNNETSTNNER